MVPHKVLITVAVLLTAGSPGPIRAASAAEKELQRPDAFLLAWLKGTAKFDEFTGLHEA